MAGVATQNSPVDRSLPPFARNWDHLSDELRLLNLRLQREMLRQPHQPAGDTLSAFKGLVISDTEAAELVTRPADQISTYGSEAAEDAVEQKLAQSLSELENDIQQRCSTSRREGVYLALARLTELFSLTRFEEQCLVVCLAPELDRKYERLFAYLQDDATRKKPCVNLILNLLCETLVQKLATRAVLDPSAPLLRFKLLQVADSAAEGQPPLLARTLKLDDRIANFLLGQRQMDARLERCARLVVPHAGVGETMAGQEFYQRTERFLHGYFKDPQSAGHNVLLYLHGPANSDQRLVVETACRNYDLPLLVADVEAIKAGAMPFDQAAWLLAREATLQAAVLCLENTDCLIAEADKHVLELKSLLEAAKTFSRLTFLFGTRHWQPPSFMHDCLFLSVAVPAPDLGTCKRFWEEGLAGSDRLSPDIDSAVLAGKFRFGLSQIKDALAAAANLARWRSPGEWQITASDIYAACRTQSSPKLGALARKIEPKYAWGEIVLPEDNLAQLKELCEQARHRHRVYGEWGFDRKLSLGKGLNALFSGPPGTGKTMAAEVIASELQLDLYRIDLSQVVSKYIGETEKNLHQIFLEAQAGNAILFFDEADALFGKRSEVKDAHDRYANIEVGYLLQKMEEYEGVAILATNLSQHIDEAFLRRMHFVVEFPFPDQQYRKRIWQVVFPQEAPLAEEVDFDVLAREIKLAGGNIKNIALAAAFYAAGNGRVIQMPHLLQAARREHQKLGRTWRETDVRI
jgi:DNA polymerase III delta prime subunit